MAIDDTVKPAYSPMMREIVPDERPRERLRQYGERSMSTGDLLAIIINVGIKGQSAVALSQQLLAERGGLRGIYQLDFEELARIKGIGEAKACKIKAALELGRRLAAADPEDRVTIEAPDDVFRLVGVEMGALHQEQLRVVLLDTKHKVIAIREVYLGTVNKAPARLSEMFKLAVGVNATAIIIVHNHPSGDPTPSAADVALTADAVRSGELLDIGVLDHLVIGQGRWVSMKRLGLGFRPES